MRKRSLHHRMSVSLLITTALLVSQLAVTGASRSAPRAAALLMSGRVYEGEAGVEPPQSTPIQGVTVVLYGSNSASNVGDALDEATTDSAGWYGLTVPEPATREFYNILVTVPGGYDANGCRSVDGQCISNVQIQYTYPLDGKTLTGNKFWLKSQTSRTATPTRTATATSIAATPTRTASATWTSVVPPATATRTPTGTQTVVVPTVTPSATGTTVPPTASPTATRTGTAVPPTGTRTATSTPTNTGVAPTATGSATRTPSPTPTASPTAMTGTIVRTFTGSVYLGQPGDRSHPLAGVNIVLYRSRLRCDDGTPLLAIVTNLLGQFVAEYATEAQDDQPYYTLAIDSDELLLRFAESASGAVYTGTGLQFHSPGSGFLAGNDFYVGSLADSKMETFDAVADAYVDDAAPSSNYGTSSVLYTAWISAAEGRRERALVRFDPVTIPQDAQVEKATLYLYLMYGSGVDPTCLSVYGVADDWCEGPICGGIAPVTWNNQPGYDAHETAVTSVGTTAGYVAWDVTTLVQSWVRSNRPRANHGLLVAGEEQGEDWIRVFTSLESSYPPQLVVYVPATTHLVTPTPTATVAPVTVDLSVQAVELTQGIQCMNNSKCADNKVPLVVGKMTFARVYVKVTGASAVSGVSAKAIATIGGKKYTAWTINTTINAKQTPDRAKFEDTLNFYLYGVDASGTLEVEVNPFGSISESDYSNNKKTVNLNFVSVPNLKVVPIWIYCTKDGAKEIVDWSMPGYLENYALKLLPVAEIDWYLLTNPVLLWPYSIDDADGTWGTLLEALANLRGYTTSMPSDAQWYGMVPFEFAKGDTSGLSQGSPNYCSIGRTCKTHTDLEDGAENMVHEFGHNLGRNHVNCGLPAGASYDTSYPYSPYSIGDYGWDWGFAAGGKKASYPDGYVVPKSDVDIMTYCQDEFVSEYTYQGIMNRLGPSPASAEAPREQDKDPAASQVSNAEMRPYLFTSGAVVDGIAELAPFSIMDRPAGSHDEPGEGPYRLRLASGSNVTLFERRFVAQQAIASYLPGKVAPTAQVVRLSFQEILPWHPETARIELWSGEQLLAERVVSAHWPQVQLLGPPGGSFWPAGGEYPINWTASDEDGTPLWFDVAFSRDGGETWDVFATGLTERHLMVSSDRIAGTENARFRVYATDGVRTSESTSGPLAIERKPPMVFITAPDKGQVFPPGVPVGFGGMALDWEDNGHADLAMHWNSSRDGWLGDGSETMVPGLSPGWHEITLSATDSDGMTGMDHVDVYVGFRLYLPVLLRKG